MSQVQNYERSLQRSHLSLTREDRPRVFGMAEREWDLLDEVFAPIYSPSTEVALDFLGLLPGSQPTVTGSFLEIGCGTGVIAVMSALAGCERVVASDINARAVENAAMNAERHGVQERLRAVHSDLFSALGGDELFDTVFWSSNYVRGPEDYTYTSIHEAAYVDAGYRSHRRFLVQAPQWVTPGGRVLLHFSDRGDVAELYRIAEEAGRELRTVSTVPVVEGEYGSDLVEHMLLEVRPAVS